MGIVSTLREPLHRAREAAHTGGAEPSEQARLYPCDVVLPDAPVECWRAIDIEAPPAVVYRWLCQLRVAPYSYDWLDNFGRQSPPALVPGLASLEPGQRFMTIFALVDFTPGSSITLRTDRARWVFGDAAVTYVAEPVGSGTRLLVKLRVDPPHPPHGWVLRWLYEPGDFVMMRKQLTTLKSLAEQTASSYAARTWEAEPSNSPPRPSLLPPPDWGRGDGPRRPPSRAG